MKVDGGFQDCGTWWHLEIIILFESPSSESNGSWASQENCSTWCVPMLRFPPYQGSVTGLCVQRHMNQRTAYLHCTAIYATWSPSCGISWQIILSQTYHTLSLFQNHCFYLSNNVSQWVKFSMRAVMKMLAALQFLLSCFVTHFWNTVSLVREVSSVQMWCSEMHVFPPYSFRKLF